MNKEEAFQEINETQDFYVKELINLINDPGHASLKMLYFSSPTGTGKTIMMAKLINLMPNTFFIITTLSKGQLNRQVENVIKTKCTYENYILYGNCDFKINSKLRANEIISKIPNGKKCIWIRDEGHIKTNRFEALLENKCFKIVNFSATNKRSDIKCNFTNTMMLRTVRQLCGTPEDAILKLIEIKKIHKRIKNYNPCAIFRCISSEEILNHVISLCNKYSLKYINITDENYEMSELCKDDNENDVIINKFKLVEGIDIRRAHVLYMDNKPANPNTTIQAIGRCRRNALLYRDDIDIFSKPKLLDKTTECFVFYNVQNMKIDSDENGELQSAFCDTISCQDLKPNSTIEVKKGKMPNGLHIIELENKTGKFKIEIDKETGFNIVKPETDFYGEKEIKIESQIYLYKRNHYGRAHIYYDIYEPISISQIIAKLNIFYEDTHFSYFQNKAITTKCEPFYDLDETITENIPFKEKTEFENLFKKTFMDKAKQLNEVKIKKRKDKIVYSQLSYTNYLDLSHIESIKNKLCHGWSLKEIADYLIYSCFKTANHTKKEDIIFYNIEEILKNAQNFCNLIPDRYERKKYLIDRKRQKEIKDYEFYRFKKNHICFNDSKIPLSLLNNRYCDYVKKVKDHESSIIGVDGMKLIKSDNGTKWIEDKSVTSKIGKYSKLGTYIERKYAKQIEEVKDKLFTGKNSFSFNNKFNSCLGYCVEYYSKYLCYGEEYLGEYLKEAKKEAKRTNLESLDNYVIVRACTLKYREMMTEAYGAGVSSLIKTISIEALIKDPKNLFILKLL